MSAETQIKLIEEKLKALISGEPALFLVETRIKPTNNIKVYIDGDQGISIEKLVYYNRKLYKEIEESALYPDGNFSLEVSSPGLDEPLKMRRQYLKNVGRFVEVVDLEGGKKEGKLLEVRENELLLEEIRGKGKKMETLQHVVPFEQIKATKIQIKF
ncbi:MAG: ribosome maturation factor [Chitinophagaceae bacterium]|nr:ribosome maturation factor [Chitinophagaceae bacterium]